MSLRILLNFLLGNQSVANIYATFRFRKYFSCFLKLLKVQWELSALRGALQFTPLSVSFRAFVRWLNQQLQAFYNDVFVFIRPKQGFPLKVGSGKKLRVFGEDGSPGSKRYVTAFLGAVLLVLPAREGHTHNTNNGVFLSAEHQQGQNKIFVTLLISGLKVWMIPIPPFSNSFEIFLW
jgi:hypothetical protein